MQLDAKKIDHSVQNAVCLYCQQDIPAHAKKCMHCGSFQTWKRHLGFWATIISLTLGVVATYGLIEGPAKEYFKPNYSISAYKVSSTRTEYTATLQNKGKQSVVILQVNAHLGEEVVGLVFPNENKILEAGEETIISFTTPNRHKLKMADKNKMVDFSNPPLHVSCSVWVLWKGASTNDQNGFRIDETSETDLSEEACTDDFKSFLHLVW